MKNYKQTKKTLAKTLSERTLSEKTLDGRTLGERTFGEKPLSEKSLGDLESSSSKAETNSPKIEEEKIVTSESVNIGHPDKTCDVLADAFLDEALRQDPESQMAVECAIKNDKLFIYGEATTRAKIDYDKIAREILRDIGYECKFQIVKEISEQSPDINRAVVKKHLCANDQGMMFGYATSETKECMPLAILVAHKIMRRYEGFRRHNNGFFADAKCQVSVKYVGKRPVAFSTIVVSVSHAENLSQEEIRKGVLSEVVLPVLEEYPNFAHDDTRFIINPSGKFTIWGSFGDSGCVGRKIVVDTYGGVGRVGGGCFSSKNATKVDRSGAYYARFVAKNVIMHNLADECEVQVSYAIGMEEPVALAIDCFGTNKVPMQDIEKFVKENFDFRLENIIRELDLKRPIFKQTACFGHFGRDEFAWEKKKDKIV